MDVKEAAVEYLPEAVPQASGDDVPPGYKRTEVGVIPEDWDVPAIASIIDEISMGPFGSDIKVSNFTSQGVPVLNGANVVSERLVEEFANFVTPSKARSLKKAVARSGDVVVTHRGTIGQISYIPKEASFERYVISQSQFRVHFLSRTVLPAWIVRYFHSDCGSRSLLNGKGHTGVPAIAQPTTMFRALHVPLPPIEEQRAIAEALSDADALIAALQRLIAKKRAIKQGTMQALLTGRQRLPGFAGEWETKTLDQLGTFRKGQGISRAQAQSGLLPCIRYGELYTAHHDYVRSFVSRISVEVAASASKVGYGDILFAGSGETKEEIGKCAAIIEKITAYAGGDIVVFHLNQGSALFFGYALNTSEVNRKKASLGQGDAVVHISARALMSIRITIPDPKEQTAIATVLADMDAEIEALEARLAKTRALKAGMMQQLLTGRIRLPLEATA